MLKKEWRIFADEVAKGAKTAAAYKVAYPNVKSSDAAGSSGRRLLKMPEVKNEIERVRADLATQQEQLTKEAIQQAAGKILTWAMKRQILHDIANGKKTKIGIKSGKPVYKVPTAQDQIKAIELDNAMTGEGWRPPEPPPPEPGGPTFNGPVYNTVIRKTVFKTRETTARGQTFQIESNE
jgi:hypothetical protein